MSALKLGIDISGFDLRGVGVTFSVNDDDALPVSTSTPLHMSLIEFNALVEALKAAGSPVEVSTRQSDSISPAAPDATPEMRNSKWFDIVLEEEETRLASENSTTAEDSSDALSTDAGGTNGRGGDDIDDDDEADEADDDGALELAGETAGSDEDEACGESRSFAEAADAEVEDSEVRDAEVEDAEVDDGDWDVEDGNKVSPLVASSSIRKTTFGSDPAMIGDYEAVSKSRDAKDNVDGENVGFFDGIRRSLGFNHDFESVPAQTISRTSNAVHNAAVRDLVRRHIQDRNWE